MEGVDLGLLLLRVVTGLTLAAHGWNKVAGGGGLAGTAGWFESIGLRPGPLHARLAASTEMASGLLLALGLLTPLAAAGFVGLMTVAVAVVHRAHGFFIVRNGYEYNLILATVGVVVAITGPGDVSLDRALRIEVTGVAGALVALVLGLGGAALLLRLTWRPGDAPAG